MRRKSAVETVFWLSFGILALVVMGLMFNGGVKQRQILWYKPTPTLQSLSTPDPFEDRELEIEKRLESASGYETDVVDVRVLHEENSLDVYILVPVDGTRVALENFLKQLVAEMRNLSLNSHIVNFIEPDENNNLVITGRLICYDDSNECGIDSVIHELDSIHLRLINVDRGMNSAMMGNGA